MAAGKHVHIYLLCSVNLALLCRAVKTKKTVQWAMRLGTVLENILMRCVGEV